MPSISVIFDMANSSMLMRSLPLLAK